MRDHSLTEAEKAFFSENGYLGPFTLVSPEQMGTVHSLLESILKQESVSTSKVIAGVAPCETSNRKALRPPVRLGNSHLEYQAIYDLVTQPALVDRMADLLGPDILLWRTKVWAKPPNTRSVLWHQDTHKRAGYGFLGDVSAWIAVSPSTIENGCMQVIPGSHKLGIIDRALVRGAKSREERLRLRDQDH